MEFKDGGKFAQCQTTTKNHRFPMSEFYSSADTNVRKKNDCPGQQSQHHDLVVLCLLYGD